MSVQHSTKETSVKSRTKICLTLLALGLGIICSIPGAGAAGNEPTANPAGTWKVTFTRDGRTQTFQPTLKLELTGDKLAGTLTRRHGQEEIEMPLEDVKLEAGEVSFSVTNQGNGPKSVRE